MVSIQYDRSASTELATRNRNRFIDLAWVHQKRLYVLVAEPVTPFSFLIESDAGGSGGRSAPGLYGSGAASDV